MQIRAGILAAGLGRRLEDETLPPKILLRFGGQSLLERHVAILRHCGVRHIDLVVGYQAEAIYREIERIGAGDMITTWFNPDYTAGAIVSLNCLGPAMARGDPFLFMDGDVLYDHRMMARLLDAPPETCFLMDRATEEGEDPVKLCIKDDVLVDFHKRPLRPYDWWGEWIGFTRFAPDVAAKVALAAERRVAAGDTGLIYEEAFRDVLLSEPPGRMAVEDVTGLPWVEIDFPEDLARAEREVLPGLAPLPAAGAAAGGPGEGAGEAAQ